MSTSRLEAAVATSSPGGTATDLAAGVLHRIAALSTRRVVQMSLGAVWLLDGVLQLQPSMFRKSFATTVLAPMAAGQPGVVAHPITWAANLVGAHPAAWNVVFALVQLAIGAGLLFRRTVKPAILVSVVWSLMVWWLGEGFGMVLTGSASLLNGAPGAVVVYAAIGAATWPTLSLPTMRTMARWTWAVVWCVGALLWLLPANRSAGSFKSAISSAASGEPGWLTSLLNGAARLVGNAGLGAAVTLAVVSAVIGIGVLSRRPLPFLAGGVAVALAFWVFGQALGGVLTGSGTDPNLGPLLVILAVCGAAGPRRAGADGVTALAVPAV